MLPLAQRLGDALPGCQLVRSCAVISIAKRRLSIASAADKVDLLQSKRKSKKGPAAKWSVIVKAHFHASDAGSVVSAQDIQGASNQASQYSSC